MATHPGSSRVGATLRRSWQRLRPARFLRGPGPEEGPVVLDRSRVFVLPTGHGALYGAALWLMLLGSVNYQASLGQGFTFLLASVAVVSILHTYHNLARLGLRAGRPEPVFAGEPVRFPIQVENGSGRHRHSVSLRPLGPVGSAEVVDLPVGSSTVWLTRSSSVRGRLALGRFAVETRFPLGLFRAWSPLELVAEGLVYPAPAPRRAWPGVPEAEGDSPGLRAGQGDFAGVRAYRPGDPPRRVHWKASARGQTLLVKEFGGGGRAEVRFDWDQLPDLGTEERLSQLCRWVLDAHEAGGAWGLRLPGVDLPLGRGAEHLHRCLGALARYGEP